MALGRSPWPLDGETEAGRPGLDHERIGRARRRVARSRSGGDQWDVFFSGRGVVVGIGEMTVRKE